MLGTYENEKDFNRGYVYLKDTRSTALNADYNAIDLYTDVYGNKYVITRIGFRGIGDGDARITLYKENPDVIPEK